MYETILKDLDFTQFYCYIYNENKQILEVVDECSMDNVLEELIRIVNMLNENDIKYEITEKLTFKIKTYSQIDRLMSIP